jgi:hypothetical protein
VQCISIIQNVFWEGVDTKTSKQNGWYLLRQNISDVNYLAELMKNPEKLEKDESENFSKYFY